MSAIDPETNRPVEDALSPISTASAPPPGDGPSSSVILIETGVVMLMAVLPTLYRSIRDFSTTAPGSPWTIYEDLESTLTNCAQVIIPVLFIIWRSGGRWSAFGIVKVKWLRDFLLMIAAYICATLLLRGARWVAYELLSNTKYRWFLWHVKGLFRGPHDPVDYLVLILLCCLIGFSEELVFRGYLIVRFEQIFKSTWHAVLLSSLLFGAIHLYQGGDGAIVETAVGLAFGLFFVRFRRLWPLVAAHALMDYWAFARLH